MVSHPVLITLLVDNEAASSLEAEHGFSAWIEAGDQRILFDTGQAFALARNARALGVDLAEASALVLSHGHFDHTGGLPDFLDINFTAPLWFGQGLSAQRFSCHNDMPLRDIGIGDVAKRALSDLSAHRRVELLASCYLAPGVGIGVPIPRLTSYEDTGGPFFLDCDRLCPDTLPDDLSMWFETEEGLVILTGCCHAGIVNTINFVRQTSGVERVSGIIGGLHLLNASPERLEQTLQFVAACSPDFVIPCHCTGSHAKKRFKEVLGEARVCCGYAGMQQEIGILKPSESSSL